MAKKTTVVNMVEVNDIINTKEGLEVKKCLPIAVKMQMVDDIVNTVSEVNKDGLFEVDYKAYDIMFTFVILREFTNIKLSPDNITEMYDTIKQNEIIDYIYANINYGEVEYIKDCVRDVIKQKKELLNSLECVISRGINLLIEKIPSGDEMQKVIKSVSKLDPNKYEIVKGMVDTINGTKVEKDV